MVFIKFRHHFQQNKNNNINFIILVMCHSSIVNKCIFNVQHEETKSQVQVGGLSVTISFVVQKRFKLIFERFLFVHKSFRRSKHEEKHNWRRQSWQQSHLCRCISNSIGVRDTQNVYKFHKNNIISFIFLSDKMLRVIKAVRYETN